MTGEWAWGLIIGFLIAFASAVWVNRDAETLGVEPPYRGLWTVIAFLFPILGLLLYVTIARKQVWDSIESAIDQVPKTKTCEFCGRDLASDAKWCDACGKTQPAAIQPISKTETTAAGKPHRMRIPYFIRYFAICFFIMALVTLVLPSGLVAPHWYEILVLQILLAIAVAAVATLRRKP